MVTPKQEVIRKIEELLSSRLTAERGKRIIYSGKDQNNKTVIVCTPESKKHTGGFGWIDVTTVQLELMKKASNSIFVFRLEGGNNYYLDYKTLAPLLTNDAMVNNTREGDHWKLRIWPNRIEILGNSKHLPMLPNRIDHLSN